MRLLFMGTPSYRFPETTVGSGFCKPLASHCYTENMRNRHEQGGSKPKPALDGRSAGELIPDILTDGLSVVFCGSALGDVSWAVSYTHLRAHETRHDLVCRLLL